MPTIAHPPDTRDALAMSRAADEIRTRPVRIASLDVLAGGPGLTLEERAELNVLKQQETARTRRLAPWRAPWRRESRAQAMARTRGARARADLTALA